MPGGVCAVLDYDVDQMADYVAEMSCRVITGEATVATTSFRKSVFTVLSSTRLPRTTILLGMNYLAKRINTLKTSGTPVGGTVNEIAEFLTVALMLGSKFLDDNTFQNKSWSDVSGIPVQRINAIETAWILAMDWVFYVNLDTASDYKAWLGSWDDWVRTKKEQVAQAAAQAARKQAPLQRIDTDLSRLNAYPRQAFHYNIQSALEPMDYHHSGSFSSVAAKRRSYQAPPPYRAQDPMWNSPSWHSHAHNHWQAAPVTPPDSGYGTPENHLSTAVSHQFGSDWYGATPAYSAASFQQNMVSNMYMPRHGSFQTQYSFGSLHHGMPGCVCPKCIPQQISPHGFFNMSSHGTFGTVMG